MKNYVLDTNVIRYIVGEKQLLMPIDAYNLSNSFKAIEQKNNCKFYVPLDVFFELIKHFNDDSDKPIISAKRETRLGFVFAVFLCSEEKKGRFKIDMNRIISSFFGTVENEILEEEQQESRFDSFLVAYIQRFANKISTDLCTSLDLEIEEILEHGKARIEIAKDFISQYYWTINDLNNVQQRTKSSPFYLGDIFFNKLREQFDRKKFATFKEEEIQLLLLMINANIVSVIYFHFRGSSIEQMVDPAESLRILETLKSTFALNHIYFIEVVSTPIKNVKNTTFANKINPSKGNSHYGRGLYNEERIKRYNDFYILASCDIHFRKHNKNEWQIISNDYELLMKEREQGGKFKHIPINIKKERAERILDYQIFSQTILKLS